MSQKIQQNHDAEMLPGDSPIALTENEPSQKHSYTGANYLMKSLMKIRDQAKQREANRQMGVVDEKYGKVKSVIAKNKKIATSVAQLKSTLQPNWNESTITKAAPKPLGTTPRQSRNYTTSTLKPAVPKHVYLGTLSKETFLESQQDRKNLTMLSPKNANFRS